MYNLSRCDKKYKCTFEQLKLLLTYHKIMSNVAKNNKQICFLEVKRKDIYMYESRIIVIIARIYEQRLLENTKLISP